MSYKEDKREYRAVRKRDRGVCRICGSPNVEIHHIVYRSLGGITHRKNMICLCKKHHMEYHARGKEGTEELLDKMRLHYGCIEKNDLKAQNKWVKAFAKE